MISTFSYRRRKKEGEVRTVKGVIIKNGEVITYVSGMRQVEGTL